MKIAKMAASGRVARMMLIAGGCVAVPTHAVAQEACRARSAAEAEAGWEAYGADDMAGARARFEAALSLCHADHYARTGLAYVALREGLEPDAVALWTLVLRAEPDNVDALTGLGLAAWRAGDLEAVATHFGRVLEIVPDHPTALDHLERVEGQVMGSAPDRPPLVRPDTLEYPARTNGDRFEVRTPMGWRPFYIKGVNLGAALPGRFPSQFPDAATYRTWIRRMAEMNANAVRVYTIHPPAFYQALLDWNTSNPQRPLWLIHGVWTGAPVDGDFEAEAYESAFFEEMHRVVDVLHGRADVEPSAGHAFGYYTADVSAWTLAYILGREWEPFSALAFDSIQSGASGFRGRYVTVEGGNAMDAWMGKAVEEIVAYETETYGAQRPVAYTNWPTLDPLDHPSETTVAEELAIRARRGETPDHHPQEYENDALALDASLVRATDRLPAGYFASFHAYPYYPDFMLLSERYDTAASTMGRSNFFGYLTELKEHHPGMPVVISEYGVPASLGVAHLQPQGWHHGGLTEREMAEIDRRLTLELAEAGMAGGALFAWVDEWFKQNWVALDFEIPQERNRLWYNRMDAEQHYGMWAVEADPPFEGAALAERLPAWRETPALYEAPELTVRAAHDGAYLWLLVETSDPLPGDTLLVGFDMIRPDAGDFRWPGRAGERLPVGIELVLRATADEVRIMADRASNPFRIVEVGTVADTTDADGGERGGSEVGRAGPRRMPVADPPAGLFHARVEQRFNLPYYTEANEDGRYDSLRVVVNRRRFTRDGTEYLAVGYDRGVLPRGGVPDGFWERTPEGHILEVRIPWLLLNVTDPSSRSVLQGPGQANTRDAVRGPDGRWRLRPGAAAWPDSVFGALGIEPVEDIGIVAALRRGTGSVELPGTGRPAARFGWPGWEEPEWRERPRPVYELMREAYGALEPYSPRPAAQPPGGGGATGGGAAVSPPPAGAATEAGAAVLAAADSAWTSGDTESAMALYETVLRQRPGHGLALHRLALMHAWEERYDRALALFDRLLDAAPDALDARVDRARVLAWSGETAGAVQELDALLEESPGHLPALEARAQFQAWAGRYEESLAGYDALLSIAPDNREARRQQAQVLAWASSFDASLAAFDSVLAMDAGDVEARLGRAAALAYSDRLDEAVAEYDRVLARAPDRQEALHGKGRALGWSGRLVDAERTLREAVRREPGDVTALALLGQTLRWQGRNAAALETLERAAALDPGNGDVREQIRALDVALGTSAWPTVTFESDSDGNAMRTTALAATWYPSPRLGVRADVYEKGLDQGALARTAFGLNLTGSLQLEPGWRVHLGLGGSTVGGADIASRAAAAFGVTTPGRYRYGGGLSFTTAGLDATAALADRDVRMTEVVWSGRWEPFSGWRLDGSAAHALFDGSESNRRTSGFLSLSHGVGGGLTLGGSARAFGFDKDLPDGYFDPDFYGIAELPARWLGAAGRWSLLAELAPGVQRVTREGDLGGTVRISGRIAYDLGPGREVSLAGGYSSTGLQSFSTGAADYRYRALILGVGWIFR